MGVCPFDDIAEAVTREELSEGLLILIVFVDDNCHFFTSFLFGSVVLYPFLDYNITLLCPVCQGVKLKKIKKVLSTIDKIKKRIRRV